MSTPFDLHVLSTPPAFILSQDQTLNKMVSKEPKLFKSLYWSSIQASKKFTVVLQAKLVWTTKSKFGASCLSRCLIYKVHTALQRREFILPHRFDLVKSFFQFFSNFSALRSARRASPSSAALAGDLISLPYLSSLVKNFFRTVRWFSFSHSSSLLISVSTVSRQLW